MDNFHNHSTDDLIVLGIEAFKSVLAAKATIKEARREAGRYWLAAVQRDGDAVISRIQLAGYKEKDIKGAMALAGWKDPHRRPPLDFDAILEKRIIATWGKLKDHDRMVGLILELEEKRNVSA